MANLIKEQNKLANSQSFIKKSNIRNNKLFTLQNTSTLSIILFIEDFFTKFIKIFIELK